MAFTFFSSAAFAPATSIVSVNTSARRSTSLRGPEMRSRAGSISTSPSWKPAAGSPSMSARTFTARVLRRSSVNSRMAGERETIWAPRGRLIALWSTSCFVAPARAPARSTA